MFSAPGAYSPEKTHEALESSHAYSFSSRREEVRKDFVPGE